MRNYFVGSGVLLGIIAMVVGYFLDVALWKAGTIAAIVLLFEPFTDLLAKGLYKCPK